MESFFGRFRPEKGDKKEKIEAANKRLQFEQEEKIRERAAEELKRVMEMTNEERKEFFKELDFWRNSN